jgi:ribonuclease P protein component
MISKINRFHGHNSLSLVYRKGKTVSVPQASLKSLPVKTDRPYRLAVVVSRKVDKSAVVRNKIRRRVYETIRNKHPSFKENRDIVITIHSKQIESMNNSNLNEILGLLLKKSEIIDQ